MLEGLINRLIISDNSRKQVEKIIKILIHYGIFFMENILIMIKYLIFTLIDTLCDK